MSGTIPAAADELAPPTGLAADRRVAEAGVLLVAVFWAGNFIVAKAAIETLPPIAFATVRFAIASIVLLAILRWREGSVGLPREDIPRMALLGGIGFGVYQLLWMIGLQWTTAGDSALLIAATPVLTVLIGVLLGTDTLTPAKLVGALVAFAGVAIVVGAVAKVDLAASLLGDALTLAAALCWAIYTAWGAAFLRRHSPLRTTTWALIFGTLTMAPIGLVQLAVTPDVGTLVLAVVPALLYSGILSAGLPNVLVFHAVRLLGPFRVSAYQFLVPAFTVVMAAILLDEPILAAQVAGGLVIVAGVLVTRRASLIPGRARRRRTRVSSRP